MNENEIQKKRRNMDDFFSKRDPKEGFYPKSIDLVALTKEALAKSKKVEMEEASMARQLSQINKWEGNDNQKKQKYSNNGFAPINMNVEIARMPKKNLETSDNLFSKFNYDVNNSDIENYGTKTNIFHQQSSEEEKFTQNEFFQRINNKRKEKSKVETIPANFDQNVGFNKIQSEFKTPANQKKVTKIPKKPKNPKNPRKGKKSDEDNKISEGQAIIEKYKSPPHQYELPIDYSKESEFHQIGDDGTPKPVFHKPKPSECKYQMGDVIYWTRLDCQWNKEVENIRKEIFAIDGFRPNQRAIINATLSGYDVFVCMPTGGGKSLTFQIPALIGKGVTIVIMPLLSLIQDQSSQMKILGIEAESILGSTPLAKQREIIARLKSWNHPPKLLYVTPEKIKQSDMLMSLIRQLHGDDRLDRFVIDEAHCVSNWGRDFRPDYLSLKSLKMEFPNIPILALTATATEKVKNDVIMQLKMNRPMYFQCSFNRRNLIYEVWDGKSKKDKIKDIINFIRSNYRNKPGIIYCSTTKDCEEYSTQLNNAAISAAPYHAKLPEPIRNKNQEDWMQDRVQIIIATIAFGMGINKADVRFVIHFNISKSIENYYQESGRAGRDGKPSHCIMLYNFSDRMKYYNIMISGGHHKITDLQVKSIFEIVKFCENKVDCRRVQQLAYFGEQFDRKNCHGLCDNCSSLSGVKETSLMEECKLIYSTSQSLQKLNVTTTLSQFVDILTGKFKGTSKYGKELPHVLADGYGCLKNYANKGLIENIATEMLIQGILEEDVQFNRFSKTAVAYLKPGKVTQQIIKDFKMRVPISSKPNRGKNIKSDTMISNQIPKQLPKKENLKFPSNNIQSYDSIPISTVFPIDDFKFKSNYSYESKKPLPVKSTGFKFDREFGYCNPSQFDELYEILKKKRIEIYNEQKEVGIEISSLDSLISTISLNSLCKWLPEKYKDITELKCIGINAKSAFQYGIHFCGEIVSFIMRKGINKTLFENVPKYEGELEETEEVFDFEKVKIPILGNENENYYNNQVPLNENEYEEDNMKDPFESAPFTYINVESPEQPNNEIDSSDLDFLDTQMEFLNESAKSKKRPTPIINDEQDGYYSTQYRRFREDAI